MSFQQIDNPVFGITPPRRPEPESPADRALRDRGFLRIGQTRAPLDTANNGNQK